MDIVNKTKGLLQVFPLADKDRRDLLVPVLKLTFRVGARGSPLLDEEEPLAVDLVDTYNGDDAATASIQRPSQLFEAKPGTDVILLGHAHPGRVGATHADVSLRVGPIHKVLRAHGFRVWQWGTFGGLSPGPARPIQEPVPLIYELAWGGSDFTDPTKPVGEPLNYSGRGVASNPKTLVHQPAAQLEYAGHPVGASGKNLPASFGAIHRHWQPRASFAGTFDKAWEESRSPMLPADFDLRFHVSVPPDQWSPTPLRGDEPMEVLGATPDGAWRLQLPRFSPGFSSVTDGKRSEHRTHLDTILLDADARTVELTWRAAIPMPLKLEMLERVMVFPKTTV